jgi:hypothetical protein
MFWDLQHDTHELKYLEWSGIGWICTEGLTLNFIAYRGEIMRVSPPTVVLFKFLGRVVNEKVTLQTNTMSLRTHHVYSFSFHKLVLMANVTESDAWYIPNFVSGVIQMYITVIIWDSDMWET